MWGLIAWVVSRPRIVDWLIKRAERTPYTPICKDGDLYMWRGWLFNPYPVDEEARLKRSWLRQNLPSIRLHRIMRPDNDRDLHDHPCPCRTIILRGRYLETRLVHGWVYDLHVNHARGVGDTATLGLNQYHKITDVSSDGVWTMFITWKYQGTWGFWVDGKKVPWKQYLNIGE